MHPFRCRILISSVIFLGSAIHLDAQTNIKKAPEAAKQEPAAAVSQRPLPYPVFETQDFARAVARGTRTRTGKPGPKYWQQRANYQIEASLDPQSRRVSGRETLLYTNWSPDTLREVAVHLRQNIFAPGAPRVSHLPVTGGVTVDRVAVAGRELHAITNTDTSVGYRIDDTVCWIALPKPLFPDGHSVELTFAWSFIPPPAPSDGREGEDGEVFFIGYWYPQVAVYDDVSGWQTDPYLFAEFYMGYADYDVHLTAPAGWLVAATGTLQNSADVLSEQTRERLALAKHSDKIIHVVTEADGDAKTATRPSPTGDLVWHFTARNVRDFAWASSAKYLWDATRAVVGPSKSDTVAIDNFFRPIPAASAWVHGARYNRIAIEFLSDYLWPYPYPQMTSVEGILDSGGMEYPMLTIIQSYQDTLRLAGNLMHEIGHMWFPMQVGSDETRYTWQDEGLTQFNSGQGTRAAYGSDRERSAQENYLNLARTGHEVEIMRHGNLFGSVRAYFTQSYMKTTTILVALRELLGDEVFLRAYREYGRRWVGKHPQPDDFFNTFNDISGQDLSWFWRTWFYETWTLDQAIAAVHSEGKSVAITIADRGLAPMPVLLAITREGGEVETIRVPVEVWLSGAREQTVQVKANPPIVRIEIDPDQKFPDSDRSNQIWQK